MSVTELHRTTALAPSTLHDAAEFVRVKRARELLGHCSPAKLYRLKNAGLIEMRRLLGTTLVSVQSINSLLASMPPVPRTKSPRAVALGSHPKPRRKLGAKKGKSRK